MLVERLFDNAEKHPERTALIFADQRWNWCELYGQVLRLGSSLAEQGIRPGDRVALWLDNSPGFIFSFFAVLARGGVVSPLNPAMKRGDYALLGQRFDAVITSRSLTTSCRKAMEGEEPALFLDVDECVLSDHAATPVETVLPQTPAIIQFSSGSTGRPKTLHRSHEQCLAEIQHFKSTCKVTVDDRVFCALPLFHAHGLANALWAAVGSAAALILMPTPQPFALRWLDALMLLEQEKATLFPGVPLMFETLAHAPECADLGSLRLCFSAGSALPEATFRSFLKRYGIAVRQLYGCTEAGSVCINLDEAIETSLSSVGPPMQGIELSIRGADDQPLPSGEVGAILFKSPAATKAYDGYESLSQQCFSEGWFRTGDMGKLDTKGYLHSVGRNGLMFTHAGHKVYTEEIEAVLASHGRIADNTVIGITSASDQLMIKAFVVLNEPLTESEFFDFCRQQLPSYKRPQQVVFVRALPKNSLGKTVRNQLESL